MSIAGFASLQRVEEAAGQLGPQFNGELGGRNQFWFYSAQMPNKSIEWLLHQRFEGFLETLPGNLVSLMKFDALSGNEWMV